MSEEDLETFRRSMKTFGLAKRHPTPAVRRALLGLVRSGHEDVREHAAALVCFLSGKARSDFDMKRRPFTSKFVAMGELPSRQMFQLWFDSCVTTPF